MLRRTSSVSRRVKFSQPNNEELLRYYDIRKSKMEKPPTVDLSFLPHSVQTLRRKLLFYKALPFYEEFYEEEKEEKKVTEKKVTEKKLTEKKLTEKKQQNVKEETEEKMFLFEKDEHMDMGINNMFQTFQEIDRYMSNPAVTPWDFGPFIRTGMAKLQTKMEQFGRAKHIEIYEKSPIQRASHLIGLQNYTSYQSIPSLALEWYLDTIERKQYTPYEMIHRHTMAMNVFVNEVITYQSVIHDLEKRKNLKSHEVLLKQLDSIFSNRQSSTSAASHDAYIQNELKSLLINQPYFKEQLLEEGETGEGDGKNALISKLKRYVSLLEVMIGKSCDIMATYNCFLKDKETCEKMYHICRKSSQIPSEQMRNVVKVVKLSVEDYRLLRKPHKIRKPFHFAPNPSIYDSTRFQSSNPVNKILACSSK